MKKIILLSFILFGFFTAIIAQNVNIPDANFRAFLLARSTINPNGDTAIQTTEAANFTGSLILNSKNISDLTGIEAFTQIRALNIANNSITSLSLGDKPKLEELHANGNQISNISISQNNTLHTIDLQSNKLEDVDIFLSRCTGIKELDLTANQLVTLNLSSNIALEGLTCLNNKIATLDFTGLNSLTRVQIGGNNFTSIDLSGNASVEFVEVIGCSDIESLNIANGNNKNFRTVTIPGVGTGVLFTATNNSKLTCIQVDDAAYSTSNWNKGNIDATASFSENCNGSANINSIKPISVSVYPNPAHNTVTLDLPTVKQVSIVSLHGRVLLKETNSNTLDIENLIPGLYIIQASDDEQTYTSRFIKN